MRYFDFGCKVHVFDNKMKSILFGFMSMKVVQILFRPLENVCATFFLKKRQNSDFTLCLAIGYQIISQERVIQYA